MFCFACTSDHIISVCGKCNDLCVVKYKDKKKEGYVPSNLGIGGEDYIEFLFCADCGCLQYSFPIHEEVILKSLSNE